MVFVPVVGLDESADGSIATLDDVPSNDDGDEDDFVLSNNSGVGREMTAKLSTAL